MLHGALISSELGRLQWPTAWSLVVPQAIVIQMQLSPSSFSVVSLGSLGWTSHGSWILKYSIWSANVSRGRWIFVVYEVFELVRLSSGCVNGLSLCLVLLEGGTRKGQLCLVCVFPACCSWASRSLLGSRAFQTPSASICAPPLTSQFVCQENVIWKSTQKTTNNLCNVSRVLESVFLETLFI